MKNKQTILIVDDTPDNLHVLGYLLEEEYDVRIATNGADALDAVKMSAPDLVLLDVLMPGMDGYEVCRIMKADADLRIIPIIFISALGLTEQKIEAFREGAVDYITKPFQAEEVLARVRTHLQLSKMDELKHEITERKKAEELLKYQNQQLEMQYEDIRQLNEDLSKTNADLIIAKARAEESDRLKTAFLHNVSHEIRTPLNAILGFSELLLDNVSKVKIDEFAGIIRNSSDRLLQVVNDILDIASIETGQVQVYRSTFSINAMIDQLYESFLPKAQDRNISLQFHNAAGDDACTINTDELKLHQIMTHLLLNAVKFSPGGTIDFGYKADKDEYVFYVTDTGLGISEDRFTYIFERFAPADSTLAGNYSGAGLGLSICKGLVAALGGSIWVESKQNMGSTFYFSIPKPSYQSAKS